ncbi:MAG: PAS domain S-box protein, partial [Lentisphaeria bacterium]|nr:PAS domain S-box protein [Lentisphaeria bacterium]
VFVNDATFYRTQLVHPDDRDRVMTAIGEAMDQHRPYELVYRIVAKDGHVHWMKEHGTGLYAPDGTLTAREGFINDITEHVSNTEEIHRQHAHLSMLTRALEQAHELVMIGDASGRIQYVNEAFERMTGYAREEVIGYTPDQIVPDWGRAGFFRRVQSRIRHGRVWRGRYVSTRKDGTLFELEATVSPVLSPGGQLEGYVAQQRVAEGDVQPTAGDRDTQKREVLGVIAGSFIRSFNSQLQAIIGFGQLAAASAEDDAETATHVERILEAAERAREAAGDLLDFVRRGQPEGFGPIALRHVASKLVRFIRVALPANVRLLSSLCEEELVTQGHAGDLEQALVSLVVGATRPLWRSGGQVEVALEGVAGKRGKPMAEFRVLVRRDVPAPPGSGGPRRGDPEAGPTAFDMAVVRDIVEEHGGTFSSRPEAASGSIARYVIALPAIPGAAVPADFESEAEEPTPAAAEGSHVLFVDDEELLGELAKLELESFGYRVTAFSSSREALAVFQQDPAAFDLVIADQTMPEITGFDMARQMLSLRADLPIVLITGYSEVVNDLQARAIGIRDYLIKPVTPETLADVIARALAGT